MSISIMSLTMHTPLKIGLSVPNIIRMAKGFFRLKQDFAYFVGYPTDWAMITR